MKKKNFLMTHQSSNFASGVDFEAEGKLEYIPAALTSVSFSAGCAFLALSYIDPNNVTVEDTQNGFEGSDEENTFNF